VTSKEWMMRSRPSIAWVESSSGSRGAGQGSSNGIVGHISELDDFPVDAAIANDNTKAELRDALKETTLEPLGFWNRSARTLADRLRGWFWRFAVIVSSVLSLY